MEITFRPYRKGDLATLERMERESFTDPWTTEMFAEIIVNPLCEITIAEVNGESVGYVITMTVCENCEILNLATDIPFRKNGVGNALMCYAESICLKNRACYLMLEVRESNVPAVTLYKKRGFSVVGVRKRYYRKPVEDALLMTKVLGRADDRVGE